MGTSKDMLARYSKHSFRTLGIRWNGGFAQLFSYSQFCEKALIAVAPGVANLDENLLHKAFLWDANLSYVCLPNCGIYSINLKYLGLSCHPSGSLNLDR